MTKDEEMALRELAGGRCAVQKVIDVLGPMSLWSKSGLEAEIHKAVEAERETILSYASSEDFNRQYGERSPYAYELANWIKARGNQ
jgi:hypothetical protein